MIGKLALRLSAISQYRPHVAYYRDRIRPRILASDPVLGLTDKTCEIHVLTSERDWLNLVWTLKSFYAVCSRRFALCIHGDKSLSGEATESLMRIFPDARIIQEREATEVVLDSLSGYPACQKLRQKNILSMKVFDFRHFLDSDRMALFDSDLMFFSEPSAWLSHVDEEQHPLNVFNGDVDTAYAVPLEVLREAGFDILERVNSGFGLVYRESLRLDWFEEFLQTPGLIDGHFWRIEQTLFALSASRFGAALLPEEYRVFLQGDVGQRPFRHYVGAIRARMYSEGMRKVASRVL